MENFMDNVTICEAHETLGSLLRRPYELLQARVYKTLAERGYADIRPAHSNVFRYIKPKGSRVSDLAELAQMTKQSMAYLAGSLEEAGYISVSPDPEDGRAKLVVLTDKGRIVWDLLVELSGEVERIGTEALGQAEIDHLRQTLRSLAAAVENDV